MTARIECVLTPTPIDTQHWLEWAGDASCGAIASFVGTTRSESQGGKAVVCLEYEAHDRMALRAMRDICEQARVRSHGRLAAVAVVHRIGSVPVGGASILVVASSPHRREALEAVPYVLDRVKAEVFVWKKEVFSDGTGLWKENCECPRAATHAAATSDRGTGTGELGGRASGDEASPESLPLARAAGEAGAS